MPRAPGGGRKRGKPPQKWARFGAHQVGTVSCATQYNGHDMVPIFWAQNGYHKSVLWAPFLPITGPISGPPPLHISGRPGALARSVSKVKPGPCLKRPRTTPWRRVQRRSHCFSVACSAQPAGRPPPAGSAAWGRPACSKTDLAVGARPFVFTCPIHRIILTFRSHLCARLLRRMAPAVLSASKASKDAGDRLRTTLWNCLTANSGSQSAAPSASAAGSLSAVPPRLMHRRAAHSRRNCAASRAPPSGACKMHRATRTASSCVVCQSLTSFFFLAPTVRAFRRRGPEGMRLEDSSIPCRRSET